MTPLTDLIPSPADLRRVRGDGMKWSPAFFQRPDGTYYETAIFVIEGAWDYSSAYINDADGSQVRSAASSPRIDYDTATRFVRGGELLLTMESGEQRVIEVEVLGDSGFFLKTAGYGAGPATNTARGGGSCTSTASTSPTAADDEHLPGWDSSVTPRSASARATPSATGSWRASSAVSGPSSG